MTCDEFRDDSAALALGALSPEEAAVAREHIAGCEACAEEYRASLAVVDQLPLAVPLVGAPPAMRSAVFAAIGGSSRGSAGATTAQSSRTPTAIRPVPTSGQPDGKRSFAARGGSRFARFSSGFRMPALAAAFAALAIVGLAAWSAWLQVQVHDLKHQQVAAALPPIVPSSPGPIAPEVNSLALISAPGTIRAQLADKSASGPSGAVFWNPQQRRCVVIARQLTPPDPGQEYRVWVHTGDKSWDGGPVSPDAQGVAQTVLPTDRWNVDAGYTISIVLQPVPADGTRQTILTGVLQQSAQ